MRIPKNQEGITKLVIEKIKSQMEMLTLNNRLCCPMSAEIAAEHDLHGTVADAIETLRLFKNKLRKYPKSQQTVEAIQLMMVRKEEYSKQYLLDPYTKPTHEALIHNDRRKMDIMMERSIKRNNEIHERKECICYN
jgi:hypothetical protein